jgi:poly(A) polymerase
MNDRADAAASRRTQRTSRESRLGRAVRWVGGAVRDTLLGNPVKDIDAATPHEPDAVVDLLGKAGIRTVPTGIDHGTVTALLPGGPVEVTTLRRDVSTDGRRATVAFATDWREDAARRDFTINALYAHPDTLEIEDYFGGLADLDARRVRFIGDARQRIREDHLRILRYYRFQARFGSALDAEAEDACVELAPTLKGLSRERVAMELLNLLALPDPAPTVARMEAGGVLPVVLARGGRGRGRCACAARREERRQGVAPDPLRRFAALLPADPRLAIKSPPGCACPPRSASASPQPRRARVTPAMPARSPIGSAATRRSTACCWPAPRWRRWPAGTSRCSP